MTRPAPLCPPHLAVQAERFGDLSLDAHHRVERARGILEHDADVRAADAGHLAVAATEQ